MVDLGFTLFPVKTVLVPPISILLIDDAEDLDLVILMHSFILKMRQLILMLTWNNLNLLSIRTN